MIKKVKRYKATQTLLAWGVHAFTASASFFGILTLYKIYQHQFLHALWLMGITVFIDAVDGSLARRVGVKAVLPHIDGTLMDNLVDYLNYVVTPCFFLVVKPGMLPEGLVFWIVIAISITSTYQFCQEDAKTPDHFFKGFPCYWNFAVFYMFIFGTSMTVNTVILTTLCILIFVPMKYVYPSRLDYLTKSKQLKWLMHSCSLIYGISSAVILWKYPQNNTIWLGLSLGYVIMYLSLSVYRTYSPMILSKIAALSD